MRPGGKVNNPDGIPTANDPLKFDTLANYLRSCEDREGSKDSWLRRDAIQDFFLFFLFFYFYFFTRRKPRSRNVRGSSDAVHPLGAPRPRVHGHMRGRRRRSCSTQHAHTPGIENMPRHLLYRPRASTGILMLSVLDCSTSGSSRTDSFRSRRCDEEALREEKVLSRK